MSDSSSGGASTHGGDANANANANAIVRLAPGAEENGLASMLAELVRQNLESKPHKKADFDALVGSVAIVAEDVVVALTLRFMGGHATVHDGIVGVPDVTVRATSDTIQALSTIPLSTPFGLPFPHPSRPQEVATSRTIFNAMRDGSFKAHGFAFHVPLMMRLTRVMSVNG